MKTGVSMGGSIVNAKKVKSIPCNCSKCYHRRKNKLNHKTYYCDYYQIENPNKNKCSRYSKRVMNKLPKNERPKKMSKAERIKSYKEGIRDTTYL